MTVSGGCNKFHDEFKEGENHHIQAMCFDTQADRLAATQIEICPGLSRDFDICDIGKIAKQTNVNPGDGNTTFWVLCGLDPVTWDEITNKTVPPDLDIKVKVSANDTTAGFLSEKLTTGDGTNVSGALEWKEINDGGDEDYKIQFDPSKIDHDDLQNSNGNKHIDWTVSGAGVIDPSNYTDCFVKASTNDATSKTLIDKLQAGSNITIVENNDGNDETITISAAGELDDDVAVVQTRRTTSYALTTGYVDLEFDTTDVENKSATIEHDTPTNEDRILIKEDGVYRADYCLGLDISSQARFDFRIRKNDSVVIPGSEAFREDGGDTFVTSCYVIFEATAGDFISLQAKRDAGAGTIEPGASFALTKLEGAKGDKGDTGSGSNITLEEGGSPVVNTPHDTIDFDGNDFDVTDNADGSATVSLAATAIVFGTEFNEAESLGENSTGSTSYQNKLTLNVTGIPAGRYRIGWSYRWRHTSTGGDFRAQVLEDGGQIYLHQQEPKDTGSNQAYRACSFANRTLTSGNHTFQLQYSEQSGGTAYISEARFEFWRVN